MSLLSRGTRALLVPTKSTEKTKMNAAEYLQILPTDLLRALACGELDAREVAAKLMADRGLDREGQWVGFERAFKAWCS
jgi:hypothetical protein